MSPSTALRRVLILMAGLVLLAGCGSASIRVSGDNPAPPRPEAPEPPPAPKAPATARAKIPVNTLDDLPPHTYPLDGTVSELIQDPAAMAELRKAYRADLESDLATYDIKDAATLQGMYGSLLTLEMIDGNDAEALALMEKIKGLEDKEAARLMTGISGRAILAARRAAGDDPTTEAFQAAFREVFEPAVFALPWDVVQDRIKGGKGRAEYLSENLILGMVQANMDPAAAAMGELNGELAGGAIRMRYALDTVLPLNPVVADVYARFIEANQVEKADIWQDRELILAADGDYTPVVIGVWDSGVDVAQFAGRLFVNEKEAFDGADTDGNGWVDDVNGIAYDVYGVKSPELLHPLGDQTGKLDDVFQYMQGFTDLTSAIDSEEASAVRKLLSSVPPAEVGDVMTSLSFGGLYMHGTHVAGISVRNNPFARVLTARITFDYHPTPVAMTMEIAERLAAEYVATAKYFRAHGVRTANMSWGWSFKEIEGSLTANGVGASAEERAAMAREMIDVLSRGLQDAFNATPEILYVTAAGNSDNDVEFDVTIPSGFDLPNLMVVGAVDQAGDPTGFTSGGRNVKVFANGFQVESVVPGGTTMKMSGTSMASPNVCNLAAKLFAMDPTLTPARVRELIESASDPHPDDPGILRINPVKSAELLNK